MRRRVGWVYSLLEDEEAALARAARWVAPVAVAVGAVAAGVVGGGMAGWAGGDPLGCDVANGEDRGGVVPVRATCEWPDRSLAQVEAVLADLEGQAAVFDALEASEVVGTVDGELLQRQVHVAPAITNREVVVAWRTQQLADGVRHGWRVAEDQSATRGVGLMPARHEGAWELHEAPTGGVVVVYEASYAPGGSVPTFLVRWFQGGGVRGVLANLHEASG